ncbi:hypothetical protein H4R18_005004 [Coemansia javaensis]|uniref:GH18 domain-containing protein n=1 Tax=Coemansia javaensis TaxID=2761396 RepID=A0A9W8LFH9_9FUNG|nr:hypothetical protein H4R18_005004 [Coemansia javaensis]
MWRSARHVRGLAMLLAAACALVCGAAGSTYKDGRVVFSYLPVQRTLSNPQWSSLTHASIAFAYTSEAGEISFIGNVVNSTATSDQNARAFIADGQKNGVKMLGAVGGQGNFSNHLGAAMRSSSSRAAFVSNAVDFVKAYGLDGLDVDWEYPGDLDDASALLSTLQALRAAFESSFGKGKKQLTTTLYNHPYLGPEVPAVNYKPYADAVDYGLVMSYDYFGSWADYTAPNAPFLDVPFYPGSFRNTTDAWLDAGWPASKLVAGLAFYGHSSLASTNMMTNATDQYVAISNHTSIEGPVSGIAGTWTWRDLREPKGGALTDPSTAGPGWTRTWDSNTMTPWLFRASDGLYIGYDDKDSLGIKMDYSLRKKLAGVMIWEMGYDYQNELLSYVRDFITQVDDGSEPSNCVPSDAELDNIYDKSRDPNFFNRRAVAGAVRSAVDASAPICSFDGVHEASAAPVPAAWPSAAAVALGAALLAAL